MNKNTVFSDDEECNCCLPEQSCKICQAVARRVYGQDWGLDLQSASWDGNSNQELISDLGEYDMMQ